MAVWHAYCDESCKAKPNKFMGVGVTLVCVDQAPALKASISDWRQRTGMRDELKWVKVSKGKYQDYCEFAMNRVANIHRGELAFAALTTPLQYIDTAYSGGSSERGIRKLFYQLILHRCVPLMSDGDRLIVFPDKSQEYIDPDELKDSLNLGIRNKYNKRRNEIIKVDPICSKCTDMGQINDIFLGALTWHVNQKDARPIASVPKTTLAFDIAKALGRQRLCEETSRGENRFAHWKFRFYGT